MNQIKHLSIRPQQGIKKVQNYVFRFADFLGRGNFSSVYKGINQMTSTFFHNVDQTVAIKYIALSSLNCQRLLQLLDQQIQIFTSLNHPNIVKCFEVLKSANNCYIVTQLCGDGDLQALLKKKGIFTQQQAIPYIRDIFEGLYYLSKKNIIHRDIKVANIFLNNKKAKIADFGFAQRSKIQFVDGKIGTPLCMSPEGFLQNIYGCKTDVWAFGIILYQLTHGRIYLDHCNSQEMLRQCVQKQIKIQQLRYQLTYQLKQLIVKCLDVNPCTRITFQEMRKHSFIQKIMKNRTQPFSVQNLNYFEPLSPTPKSMTRLPDVIKQQNSSQSIKQIKNQDNNELSFLKNNLKFNKNFNGKQNNSQFGNQRIFQGKVIKKQDKKEKINLVPIQFENKKPIVVKIKQMNTTKNQQQINQQKQQNQNVTQGLSFQKRQKLFVYTTEKRLTYGQIPMNLTLKKQRCKIKTQHDEANSNNQIISPRVLGPNDKIFSKGRLNVERRSSKIVQKGLFTKNKKLIAGFLKFNQAIGMIHYCRLLYKYIIELKITKIYQQGNLNLKYYSNFLLNLLGELQEKLMSGHIIITKKSGQLDNKQNKITKMLKVVQQYIQRYKPNLQKQRADILNKTIEQIKQIMINDKKLVQTFYVPDKTKLEYYHEKILIFTELLQKSSKFQKYNVFDSNSQLEDTTKDSNPQKTQRSHKQLQFNNLKNLIH